MKDMLIKQMNQCKYKLDIAQRLTDLLSDEKVRWGNDIQLLTEEAKLIPGNSLIASGMISYAGAFIASYRAKLEVLWINQLDELKIIHTEGIKMVQYLGNPVDIQQWNIAKLPKDDTSIENGIIVIHFVFLIQSKDVQSGAVAALHRPPMPGQQVYLESGKGTGGRTRRGGNRKAQGVGPHPDEADRAGHPVRQMDSA